MVFGLPVTGAAEELKFMDLASSCCSSFGVVMRSSRNFFPQIVSLVLMSIVVFAGCKPEPEKTTFIPPVTVAHPVKQDVTLYVHFTGTVQAVDSVDVEAHITGYLEEIKFKSGSDVKKGDVLFIIDQSSFKAQVDRTNANVAQAKAQRTLAHVEYQRDQQIQKQDAGAIAQVTLDRALANVGVQDANVLEAEATLEEAQVNLDYCTIKAPISGHISRNYVSIGNLLTGGTSQATLLTTIVSVDPIYAYCDVDERSIERFQKMVREGEIPPLPSKQIPVELGLPIDGDEYPHKGVIDFVENQYTTNTGTLQVRGVFQNPLPKVGTRVLAPGQFAKLRVPRPSGDTLLISEKAVSQDVVGTFVVVVNDKNIAEYRYIKTGSVVDGMQVIEKGLTTEDLVVVDGIHNARPGAEVKVTIQPPPVSAQPGPSSKTETSASTASVSVPKPTK